MHETTLPPEPTAREPGRKDGDADVPLADVPLAAAPPALAPQQVQRSRATVWWHRAREYARIVVRHTTKHTGVGIVCAVAYFDP